MDEPVQNTTVKTNSLISGATGVTSSPGQSPQKTPVPAPPVSTSVPPGSQPSKPEQTPTPPSLQPLPAPGEEPSAPSQPTGQFPPPPPPKTPPKEEPTFEKKDKTKAINFLMLTLGPAFMIGALIFSFLNIQSAKQPAVLQEEGMKTEEEFGKTKIGQLATEEQKANMRQILLNSPKNPDQVTAVCQSTNAKLESGVPTDCPDPVFEWSGEEVQEEGTKIVGYYVYFGTNSDDTPISMESTNEEMLKRIRPKRDGVWIEEPKFSPTDLEKGTVYYLAVNAISDSNNEQWRTGLNVVSLEDLSATIAKIIFIYDFQEKE